MAPEHETVAPEVREWVESTDFRWLEEVTFDGLPIGSVGKKESDFMVRLEAMYHAADQAIPGLQFSFHNVRSVLG